MGQAMIVCRWIVPGVLLASVSLGGEFDNAIERIIAGAKDDAEKAQRLHDAGRLAKDDLKLRIALWEAAAQYGLTNSSDEEARTLAEKSLDLLLEEAPDKTQAWQTKKLDLYRRWYRFGKTREEKSQGGEKLVELLLIRGSAADREGKWAAATDAYREARVVASPLGLDGDNEIAQLLSRAIAMKGSAERIARLVTALQSDSKNEPVRLSLVKALLVEMDDPATGAKYLSADLDEVIRTCVPLAAKPVSQLPANACRDLANWYHRELSKAPSPLVRGPMLLRAKTYYERFLQLHAEKDDAFVVARAGLDQVEKQLAATRWQRLANMRDDPVLASMEPGLVCQFHIGSPLDKPLNIRTDPNVWFEADSAPATAVPHHGYMVEWTGVLRVPETDDYTFEAVSVDDCACVWIGDKVVVSDFRSSQPRSSSPLRLKKGFHEFHALLVNDMWGARLKLTWSRGGSPDKQPIPPKAFLHKRRVAQPPRRSTETVNLGGSKKARPGLAATFFDDTEFKKPIAQAVHPHLCYSWGLGPPQEIRNGSGYSVQWRGWLRVPEDGRYVFTLIRAGNAVWMELDDKLLSDKLGKQQVLRANLTKGSHKIQVRMSRDGWVGSCILGWWKEGDEFGGEPISPDFLYH